MIVYTPTGHMAVVYLPPPRQEAVRGSRHPLSRRRGTRWRASVSCFGTYIVQPKSQSVFHYQLGAANPTAVGGSFMEGLSRNPRCEDDYWDFPPTMLNGQQVRNTLTLKRVAGLADMWAGISSLIQPGRETAGVGAEES